MDKGKNKYFDDNYLNNDRQDRSRGEKPREGGENFAKQIANQRAVRSSYHLTVIEGGKRDIVDGESHEGPLNRFSKTEDSLGEADEDSTYSQACNIDNEIRYSFNLRNIFNGGMVRSSQGGMGGSMVRNSQSGLSSMGRSQGGLSGGVNGGICNKMNGGQNGGMGGGLGRGAGGGINRGAGGIISGRIGGGESGSYASHETRKYPHGLHVIKGGKSSEAYKKGSDACLWPTSLFTVKPEAPGPGKPAVRPAKLLSIVVVDNNIGILGSIERLLNTCGYDVRAFANPFDALSSIKDEPCNILVAANRMKQMNGSVLANLAKKSGDATHALLMADRNDFGIVNLLRREQFDGILMKPISKYEMTDKLNEIIDAARGAK